MPEAGTRRRQGRPRARTQARDAGPWQHAEPETELRAEKLRPGDIVVAIEVHAVVELERGVHVPPIEAASRQRPTRSVTGGGATSGPSGGLRAVGHADGKRVRLILAGQVLAQHDPGRAFALIAPRTVQSPCDPTGAPTAR
jgi:hypothetical protein